MNASADRGTRTLPRVCPECGADRWKMRDSERLYDANMRYARDIRKMAAEKGIAIYERAVIEDEHRDHMSRALRKIARQARVIKRLEARLRELGAQPYVDAPIEATAPGADFDAAQAEGEA